MTIKSCMVAIFFCSSACVNAGIITTDENSFGVGLTQIHFEDFEGFTDPNAWVDASVLDLDGFAVSPTANFGGVEVFGKGVCDSNSDFLTEPSYGDGFRLDLDNPALFFSFNYATNFSNSCNNQITEGLGFVLRDTNNQIIDSGILFGALFGPNNLGAFAGFSGYGLLGSIEFMPQDNNNLTLIDNFRVYVRGQSGSRPVSEPASLILCGAGLFGLMMRRRKG